MAARACTCALSLALALSCAAGALAGGAAALARADEGAPLAGEMTPAAGRAVERGLERLVALQNPHTGEFGERYTVASTALAGLALLASGEVSGRGRRAEAVAGAVHYLLNAALTRPAPDLVFFTNGRDDQGKMHSHGLAMLFLAECYGTTDRDREIRDALRGAIRTTLRAQTTHGGWGYYIREDPLWREDEASVTITQIQALRACRNAGLAVPSGAIDAAVEYVRRSMTADGSCRYSLTMAEGWRTSFELTAAAVSTLHASGIYDSPEVRRGLEYLRREIRALKSPGKASHNFYFYGNLYAAQAMFQAGGEDWRTWFSGMRDELVKAQKPSGGWEDERNFGEAYATASALLILQVPARYLPIFAD